MKRSGPFSETPDSENCKVAVLLPFPKISSYQSCCTFYILWQPKCLHQTSNFQLSRVPSGTNTRGVLRRGFHRNIVGDRFLSSAGIGKNCALPMRLPNPKSCTHGSRNFISTGSGVWRKAPVAFPDPSSVLDKFQSAILASLACGALSAKCAVQYPYHSPRNFYKFIPLPFFCIFFVLFTGIRCGVDYCTKTNKSGQILDQRWKIFLQFL